jgi:putative membrane protein
MKRNWMIATALAATTVAGAHAAAAQTPAPTPTPTPTERTRPQPPSPTASAPRSSADQEFLAKATEGGLKEVELGKLASQKASNADVKAFAARMIDDHGKGNAELARIAGSSAPKPAPEKLAPPTKLTTATGADFDRAYMAEMVMAHQNTVAMYEKQLRDGQDEAIKKFVSEKLPTVKDHLEKARAVQAKVGMPTTE